jgi:alpha-L-rhamnosidase
VNAPNHLKTDADAGSDGLTVTGARPHLSWRLPAGWTHQDGYTLAVRIDGVDQPEVSAVSRERLVVDWPWRPLTSGETVDWRVCAHDGDQRSDWSEWHTFEAGLLALDWSASWISPDEPDDAAGTSNRPAYSLEGAFAARAGVVRARLYATALGVYEVFVNGRRVGDTQLAPGSTSFDETLYAQAHDLAPYLVEGRNTVEVLVSDGWYRGKVGTWREPAPWGTRTGVRLEVHLEHDKGTRTVVGTGPGWTSRRSAITHADLMDGQVSDLLHGPGEPSPALVDAVQAPPADWSPAPAVRVVESLRPRSITRAPSGAFVVDFGQNASGWVRLADVGPAGTRTVIEHGEHLGPDGDLDTRHLDSARPGEDPIPFVQRDEVVSSGTPGEVFEPRHTVHGFRYARVTRDDVGGPGLDPAAITMQVVHTDLAATGSFECSDADLNRLHEAARWSFRGNAVDVPTDCPTRERLGWTGDYQLFVSTAVRLFDVDGFSRKWLRSVRDDQLPDGRIVNSSPDPNHLQAHPDPMVDHITGSAGWGDAIVHVPWVLYETYGDHVVLQESWEAMTAWVEFALGAAASARHPSRVERSAEPLAHERYLWDGTFHWGEWSEPKRRAEDGTLVSPMGSDPRAWFMADKGEVGTAFLHRSLTEVAAVAGVLGKDGRPAATATWPVRSRRPGGPSSSPTTAASPSARRPPTCARSPSAWCRTSVVPRPPSTSWRSCTTPATTSPRASCRRRTSCPSSRTPGTPTSPTPSCSSGPTRPGSACSTVGPRPSGRTGTASTRRGRPARP